MTINLQQLTALLPLLIMIFTAVIVILSISYNRNHFFVAVLSTFGFIFSFFSLYLSITILPIDINGLFYITHYSILYIIMIIFSSISACIFGYSWLKISSENKEEFYLLVIISHLGAISLVISNHMASLFVSVELLSLPVFGLIAYSQYYKNSLEAALKYIILSSITSSFLLFGIAWIYAVSGNLSFISIIPLFNNISNNETLVLLFGISMILCSLLFKLSIIPFHLWTPDVYQGTPAAVLSFFSTVGKISIFVVLLNLLSHISYGNKIIYFILLLTIIFSILFGNLMAMFQNNIRRLFAYSSISQLGYLLIIFLVSNKNYFFSLEASAIYLYSYLFSNIAFFGIINLITNANKTNHADLIESYQGLFWSQPLLSIILTLVLLSLSGIPMTLGFIGKFYILSIIIKEHLWVMGLIFLIGTILGLYCYLRVILSLYSKPLKSIKNQIIVSNHWIYTGSGAIIFFSGIILLILGIYPNELIYLVKSSIEL
ncbi:NADH-quinone oxidoreductase subunit N [Buchnera aphidicola (Macrosiphoniella sanborni)]|uniref:NADH-quinone oxidoreductase subunit N n=1 Tax=Buchnera aphidicola (Macrosiphoniella sanborni) TaxID=1241865 RepID=A0A4D6YB82_9GAMM|nr:NADH-quinone oxidoreductase subunit N [Buchnera aphidicola]QCI23721.1 NADH-quinone oxidoreductase subunit N [Buchnera aphidicola (Macrosiphoniella sanborni)]